MELSTVKIEKPEELNVILGMSHFIKTVEDIHEALVQSAPGIKFGLAFCESSGEALVRWSGNDDDDRDSQEERAGPFCRPQFHRRAGRGLLPRQHA
jgi:adenosine/AMP kinase